MLVRLLLSGLLMLAAVLAAAPLAQRLLSGSRSAEAPWLGGLLDRRPARAAPAPAGDPTETGSNVMYRWRGADGTVHIESYPPGDASGVEIIEFQRMTRPAAGPEVSPPAPAAATPAGAGGGNAGGRGGDPFAGRMPDSVDELIERMGETFDLLDERRRTLEELKGEL